MKNYTLPDSDQILAELIQLFNYKVINPIWNEEELPDEWKEFITLFIYLFITLPIYMKGDKTDCSKYRGISLLSTL
jgi:hypothetical protein